MDDFMVLCTFRKGTVTSEVFAESSDGAAGVVATLPMAQWWDIDVFPEAAPTLAVGAS